MPATPPPVDPRVAALKVVTGDVPPVHLGPTTQHGLNLSPEEITNLLMRLKALNAGKAP